MSWKRWFPDQGVPLVLEGFVRSGVLKDKTSERDSAVHFEGSLLNGDTLVLWINPVHADPEKRYALEIWTEDKHPETVLETDHTEEAVDMIHEILSQMGGPRMVK